MPVNCLASEPASSFFGLVGRVGGDGWRKRTLGVAADRTAPRKRPARGAAGPGSWRRRRGARAATTCFSPYSSTRRATCASVTVYAASASRPRLPGPAVPLRATGRVGAASRRGPPLGRRREVVGPGIRLDIAQRFARGRPRAVSPAAEAVGAFHPLGVVQIEHRCGRLGQGTGSAPGSTRAAVAQTPPRRAAGFATPLRPSAPARG